MIMIIYYYDYHHYHYHHHYYYFQTYPQDVLESQKTVIDRGLTGPSKGSDEYYVNVC